ncbi:MAG: oxidoreductase [Rhodospirillaceae bacterium]|nr:oxidoreductase [Rhodospirillaceae bacterium]|tara:strand:- start:16599 stop:17477 length:879 start_codon:yes stop_codon:yes gene_type:complete
MSAKKKTAFIGLGVMGFPMAGHLSNNGFDVTVYNRTSIKAEQWTDKYTGKKANSPSEAAEDVDYMFCCVGNDNDLREVAYGPNGFFAGIKPGSVIVDHTTTSAEVARELYAEAKSQNCHFLDAPVSGGQAGAEQGTLTIMVGGDQVVFDRTNSVMETYGQAVTWMGDSGAGQLSKMVNQICIAGLVQALAEGLNFSQRAGLDGEKLLNVISKGAAQSWQMENRGLTMLRNEFNFGFAVDWMRKDLGICMDEAKRNGAELPITKVIDEFYAKVQEKGGNRLDTSSLMTLLAQN